MIIVKDLLNLIKKDRDFIEIEIYVEKENHLEQIKSFTLSWLDLEDRDLYLPSNLANSTIKEFQVIQYMEEDEDFDGEWVYTPGNQIFQILIQE